MGTSSNASSWASACHIPRTLGWRKSSTGLTCADDLSAPASAREIAAREIGSPVLDEALADRYRGVAAANPRVGDGRLRPPMTIPRLQRGVDRDRDPPIAIRPMNEDDLGPVERASDMTFLAAEKNDRRASEPEPEPRSPAASQRWIDRMRFC